MILDDQKLADIIVRRPNQSVITQAQKDCKKLMMHVKGVGLKNYIEQINKFEKNDLIAIRQKYAVSNKDLFSRILRPRDKIFGSKGGSVYYNLPDSQTAAFKTYLSNVKYGYSIRKWLEIFWMPALDYDPMGLIFVEIDADGFAYPTYKSIMDVYDYKLNGRNLEYVIFSADERISQLQGVNKNGIQNDGMSVGQNGPITLPSTSSAYQATKIYRVVDDVSDRLITINGNTITDIPNEAFPNYFLKVPASVISDIFDPVTGRFMSDIDTVIEKADQFLQQGSVKNVFKNYFGFPTRWEYQSACPECKGTGVLGGKECTQCHGSGIKARTDESQTVYLPVPQSREQPTLAPDIAGYVTPDIKGWDQMDKELKLLENSMFQTLWGTQQVAEAKNDTATGKFIDSQPVNERLNSFADSAELMETFLTDLIGERLFGLSYKGASITYGRRFIIESPDVIWKKYEDARKNGSPTTALDELYIDYLESRYSANALELQRQMKLFKLEPTPHLSLTDMGQIQGFPAEIYLKKVWYVQWKATKTDPDLLYGKLAALQTDFQQYCDEQDEILQQQQEIPPAGDPAPSPGDPAPVIPKKQVPINN